MCLVDRNIPPTSFVHLSLYYNSFLLRFPSTLLVDEIEVCSNEKDSIGCFPNIHKSL